MGMMKDIALQIEEEGWQPWLFDGLYKNQEGQIATFTQIVTNTVPVYNPANPFGSDLP